MLNSLRLPDPFVNEFVMDDSWLNFALLICSNQCVTIHNHNYFQRHSPLGGAGYAPLWVGS